MGDEGKRHLDIVTGSAKRMGKLIDDLLHFCRMGRSSLHYQQWDMTHLVQEAVREVSWGAQGRNIEWQIAPLANVWADRAMLKQVWVNLLSNAVKYTRNRERAEITIGVSLRETEFEFFVRDNGAGFDMRYSDKLFGVFQRLHSEKEFEGTGIGLANVRRIIQRHGGRTWAESKVDQGATFFFTLPVTVRKELCDLADEQSN
jgi:light-regulated signal transduction histidine kinase (bacteriophytochrome)